MLLNPENSHLPYLTAACLLNTALAHQSLDDINQSKGPGFYDSTRLAGSDPDWGLGVCKTNKNAINSCIIAMFILGSK